MDGSIKGTVKSSTDVTIGKTGVFEGDLIAGKVLISGHFTGNISAHRLEIVAGGRVDGEVEIAELVIESGGCLNGSSRIRSNEEPRQISYENADNEVEDVLNLQPDQSIEAGSSQK